MKPLALVLSLLALPTGARADALVRGMIAPSREQPAEVRASERVRMIVQVASGLTPPPGIQTERALRGFHARACRALPHVGCTSLTVRNVRPTDAHSLVYSVEAPLPRELSAGLYDLELRFPGGVSRVTNGLRVLPAPNAHVEAAVRRPGAVNGCALGLGSAEGAALGLLLLAISRKLAPNRRPRTSLE